MRHVFLTIGFTVLAAVIFNGCGGHEGGVIDVPLNENPYQVSDLEQQKMNSAIVETAGMSEEEIEEFEEAKKQQEEAE